MNFIPRRSLLPALALVMVLPSATAARAAAAVYAIDSAHSSAEFTIKHMLVDNVVGTITNLQGTINLDPADPAKSSVDVTLDVNTISTREEKRDQHLKSPDFFDVAKFPTATFKSTGITKVAEAPDHVDYKVAGKLTLHGITKDIVLPMTQSGPVPGPNGTLRVGFEGTVKLQRADYAIGTKVMFNPPLIAGEVTINLNVAANTAAK